MTDGASTGPGDQAAPMPNAADKRPAVPPAAMPQIRPNTPPGVGFAMRIVPKATAAERLMREEGMARALKAGARPYRDAEGKGRHIPFKEANLAAVEPWVRDPRAKRGYRRTQELRKAAGQLIGQPGDKIEIAKRLGELHWEQGSDIEGAARRGLYDAIWSREHVYDTFTVPRRYGRTTLIDTGRIAAVAEEEGRKIQAEDPKARGGFWVRDRNDFGLLYVVPNADPVEEAEFRQMPLVLAAAEAEEGGSSQEERDTATERYDPSAVPSLVGDLDIANFIADRQQEDRSAFRQAAFETGLDPDRAEFFRDLLSMAPEAKGELIDRAHALFSGHELLGGVRTLIDQFAFTDDPEIRRHLLRGQARHARPPNPNEQLALEAMPLLPGRGPGRRRPGKRVRGLEGRFVLPPQERKIAWNEELTAPELRSFPETGTTLYSVPNQPVAEWVLRNGRPLGFKTNEEFRAFTDLLHGTVSKLDPQARIAMRGSAVNGVRYDSEASDFSSVFFDMKLEKASDFDIAVVSPELLRLAQESNIPVSHRNGGFRTGPLRASRTLNKLGLAGLLRELRKLTGREDISFMIYESVDQLERRGTTMLLR